MVQYQKCPHREVTLEVTDSPLEFTKQHNPVHCPRGPYVCPATIAVSDRTLMHVEQLSSQHEIRLLRSQLLCLDHKLVLPGDIL